MLLVFTWFRDVYATKPCKKPTKSMNSLCIENNLTTIGSWILLVFKCFGNEKALEFMDFIGFLHGFVGCMLPHHVKTNQIHEFVYLKE